MDSITFSHSKTIHNLKHVITFITLLFTGVVAPPTGCSYTSEVATCSYSTMSFPLDSNDFPQTPCAYIIEDVTGQIPANAFSGVLTCTDTSNTDPILHFKCTTGSSLSLHQNVFKLGSLSWLTQLKIQDCTMASGFPSSVFSKLTGIDTFIVDGGSVASLSSNSLAGLNGLTAFTFQSTFTDATLPSGFFANTPNIRKLTMATAGLSSLPAGIFDGLTSLTNLDISDNSLTTLPNNLFKDFLSVTDVALDGNGWDCTCDIAWLVQWQVYVASGVTVTKDACNTPAAYSGVSMELTVFSSGCFSYTYSSVSSTTSGNSDDTMWLYIGVSVGGVALMTSLAALIIAIRVLKRVKAMTEPPVIKTKITPLKTWQ